VSEPFVADAERRFGGLRRLYGAAGAQRIFDAHVMVVGIGGVGSWVVEALARSGVGCLTLVDMDHVAESNINRQVHALTATLGQSKVEAMRERIGHINPQAVVQVIDDFVTPDNWLALADAASRAGALSAVVDACDQTAAKAAMAGWALPVPVHFLTVGAAGGKTQAHRVEIADIADATHDPLLAQLRYRLRKSGHAPRQGPIGVPGVFSREAVKQPDAACAAAEGSDGSLNCHGYGSSVAVTACFGMAAAGWVLDALASGRKKSASWHPAKGAKRML